MIASVPFPGGVKAERKSNDGMSILYHLIHYKVKDMLPAN